MDGLRTTDEGRGWRGNREARGIGRMPTRTRTRIRIRIRYLRIVSVLGLVVEDVEKGLDGARSDGVADGPAERVAGLDERRDEAGVAEGGDRRVARVDRMEDGALPVRVLVDHRVEYLGQVVVVRVADVGAQDAVSTVALEAGLHVLVAEPVDTRIPSETIASNRSPPSSSRRSCQYRSAAALTVRQNRRDLPTRRDATRRRAAKAVSK